MKDHGLGRHQEQGLSKGVYIGLFSVSVATLTHELLLTRIWSVTMGYHFAFMALSITLFGLTAGALLVYLFPDFFSQERRYRQLAVSSLLFALSIAWSFLTQACIPFAPSRTILGLYLVGLIYFIAALPFLFAGICITLALTRFSHNISKLYAANLSGSALGCLAVIGILEVTDGPTAVFVTAAIASVGAISFAQAAGKNGLLAGSLACFILLTGFSAINTVFMKDGRPLLRTIWVRGRMVEPPLYEKWNSISRVTVGKDEPDLEKPQGWGLSPVYQANRKFRQRWMYLDGMGQTVLTQFSGDIKELDFLKYDITNIGYSLRSKPDVLILGAGGGRDVLSALAFGASSVTAVEINKDVLHALNQRFGDFTGHLDRFPGVSFVNDEARNCVARSARRFDIIQISLIDTPIASSSGVLALTDNWLYTVEAWRSYLEHLSRRGILSCSRWYLEDQPGEIHRLVAIASWVLRELGVKRPADHIVVVGCKGSRRSVQESKAGTVLVAREPFSDADLQRLDDWVGEKKFKVMQSPRSTSDTALFRIASGRSPDAPGKPFPIKWQPPTDDSPFFYYMVPAKKLFSARPGSVCTNPIYTAAETLLAQLLIVVILLTAACIFLPLCFVSPTGSFVSKLPFLIFFAASGAGFMLIEISQMQRLVIFLGHPTYSLSVVLFSLLVSSSLGSYLTARVEGSGLRRWGICCLAGLVAALLIYGLITPSMLSALEASQKEIRIFSAVAILFPIGLLMGTPCPLLLRLASGFCGELTPWLWGINGAASVCASVISLIIAIYFGISAVFWTGTACYIIACAAICLLSRQTSPAPNALVHPEVILQDDQTRR